MKYCMWSIIKPLAPNTTTAAVDSKGWVDFSQKYA